MNGQISIFEYLERVNTVREVDIMGLCDGEYYTEADENIEEDY